jgi:putative transposase
MSAQITSTTLAESFVDSFKTELITDRVWRTRSQLELAVVEYIGWYNAARLHESLGDIPPLEYEQQHADRQPTTLVGRPHEPLNPVPVEPGPAHSADQPPLRSSFGSCLATRRRKRRSKPPSYVAPRRRSRQPGARLPRSQVVCSDLIGASGRRHDDPLRLGAGAIASRTGVLVEHTLAVAVAVAVAEFSSLSHAICEDCIADLRPRGMSV